MVVDRNSTMTEKYITKGKGYNTNVSYRPKYNFIEKKTISPLKYKKKEDIPFQDSRFDIFYGTDLKYTS